MESAESVKKAGAPWFNPSMRRPATRLLEKHLTIFDEPNVAILAAALIEPMNPLVSRV